MPWSVTRGGGNIYRDGDAGEAVHLGTMESGMAGATGLHATSQGLHATSQGLHATSQGLHATS
jgi:hypothetical protein